MFGETGVETIVFSCGEFLMFKHSNFLQFFALIANYKLTSINIFINTGETKLDSNNGYILPSLISIFSTYY